MGLAERGRELMRLRRLIRTHKEKEGNARCWLNDVRLYSQTLPEGGGNAGRMDLPEAELLRNCKRYIRGQQCPLRKRRKKKTLEV